MSQNLTDTVHIWGTISHQQLITINYTYVHHRVRRYIWKHYVFRHKAVVSLIDMEMESNYSCDSSNMIDITISRLILRWTIGIESPIYNMDSEIYFPNVPFTRRSQHKKYQTGNRVPKPEPLASNSIDVYVIGYKNRAIYHVISPTVGRYCRCQFSLF